MNSFWKSFLTLLAFVLTVHEAEAISVGKTAEDSSVAAQLEAFEIHPDFEINLFADESMGIANPVAMHWDEQGRLWVLTTLTYAQLEPGENPNDTLVILEDTDGDGKADESTVFADQLDMPMGFAVGDEGVYLGVGPDLLLLKDTDGDNRADSREVLLTGFGTGDTHQNISNFTWGPDGCLYFAQGLHCYSRVETPWGIVRGDAAGFWRFHPETLKLEPFCFPSLASQNPCGMAFDDTGALFLKSNNRELIYVTPGLIPTTHRQNLVPVASIGATPGKSMGAEFVDTDHLPDWLQKHMLISGYYAHRVSAFPLVKEGAGYSRVEHVELLVSKHSSFRPVETRIGPDGAIYVADWFNPIIGHYQASLRHPDRDEKHGRIWRLTAKGRELDDRSEWQLPSYDAGVIESNHELLEAMAASPDARTRLDAIIGAANLNTADAIAVVLKTLDAPRDRFIDYALTQAIHGLSSKWLSGLEKGSLEITNIDRLAFALETVGGERAVGIARQKLKSEALGEEAKSRLLAVVARAGSADDLASMMNPDQITPAILDAMIESWPKRKVRPSGSVDQSLEALLSGDDELLREKALQLAGLWKVKPLSGRVGQLMKDEALSHETRAAAARAFAMILRSEAVDPLITAFNTAEPELKPSLAAALLMVAPGKAAQVSGPVIATVSSDEEAAEWLTPFFTRKGGVAQLTLAMKKAELSPEAAGHLASAMSQLGRNEEALLGVLHDAMGISAGARAYSVDFVQALVKEVESKGDPAAGREIYGRAQLTCAACHQLDGVGGIIGPSLDAVGAGLTTDLLIESVLWPQRQMKEGYFAVAVSTKSGDTFSGYREKEQDGLVYLRDTASDKVQTIPRVEVSRFDNVGSLMPQGLTNGLSREELRDLIAYLASLKG